MLEAASVQRRRLSITFETTQGVMKNLEGVVVLDVKTEQGTEVLTIKHNDKISFIETAKILGFRAKDQLMPLIQFP